MIAMCNTSVSYNVTREEGRRGIELIDERFDLRDETTSGQPRANGRGLGDQVVTSPDSQPIVLVLARCCLLYTSRCV